jgi:hypothetical protein
LAGPPAATAAGVLTLDWAGQTSSVAPHAMAPVVGAWRMEVKEGRKVLALDGSQRQPGEPPLTEEDYFPLAVVQGVADFSEGEISVRFQGLDGRLDQAAGIAFNLKLNGDYLVLRANCLEDNLVLWEFKDGKRGKVKWVADVPSPAKQWHELKVVVKGAQVSGYLNGRLHLTHHLPAPVSGQVGLWSKADSHMLWDGLQISLPGR